MKSAKGNRGQQTVTVVRPDTTPEPAEPSDVIGVAVEQVMATMYGIETTPVQLPLVSQVKCQLTSNQHSIETILQVQRGASEDLLLGTDVLPKLGFFLVCTPKSEPPQDLPGCGQPIFQHQQTDSSQVSPHNCLTRKENTSSLGTSVALDPVVTMHLIHAAQARPKKRRRKRKRTMWRKSPKKGHEQGIFNHTLRSHEDML